MIIIPNLQKKKLRQRDVKYLSKVTHPGSGRLGTESYLAPRLVTLTLPYTASRSGLSGLLHLARLDLRGLEIPNSLAHPQVSRTEPSNHSTTYDNGKFCICGVQW